MVEAGIDQLTIVLLAHDDVLNNKNRRWNDIANEIIFEVEERLNLIDILGERGLMKKDISGYSIGYSYGYHDFSTMTDYELGLARVRKNNSPKNQREAKKEQENRGMCLKRRYNRREFKKIEEDY